MSYVKKGARMTMDLNVFKILKIPEWQLTEESPKRKKSCLLQFVCQNSKTSLLLFCVIVVASTKRESTSTKEAAKAIFLHDKDDRKNQQQCISLSLVDVAYTRCDNHRVWGPLEGASPLITQQQKEPLRKDSTVPRMGANLSFNLPAT